MLNSSVTCNTSLHTHVSTSAATIIKTAYNHERIEYDPSCSDDGAVDICRATGSVVRRCLMSAYQTRSKKNARHRHRCSELSTLPRWGSGVLPLNNFEILCAKSYNFEHTCTVLQCVTGSVSLNAVQKTW